MILKTSRTIYSQVTLIPWSSMDTEIDEIPERGLHWGTRDANYIVSSWKPPTATATAVPAAAPFRKPKTSR